MALCTTWFTILVLLVGVARLLRGYERLELRQQAIFESVHEGFVGTLKWALRLHRPEALPAYYSHTQEDREKKLTDEEREACLSLLGLEGQGK